VLGSSKANTRATMVPGPNRDALRFTKSKVIPSLSCSGEDDLSVVHVSFAKGLAEVEGRGR